MNIDQSVQKLLEGEVIAIPTESVYGLSVDALNPEAVKKLLKLKSRNFNKGFILITDDLKNCQDWLQIISPEHQEILKKIWPGPVTYLIPSSNQVPVYLKGDHETLAIRISAHPVLSEIAKKLGRPLVSTSANLTQHLPAKSVLEIKNYFGEDFFIAAGALGNLDKPTAIFDLLSGKQIR